MKNNCATIVALGSAILLAGCGGKAEDSGQMLDKGQVVATVDGKDVTVYELNAELQGKQLPTDPKQRKLAEQAALQQLISRKILADIALERKLDKSPNYLLQERRARDALLVQMLQQQISSQVPRPTREDAGRFIEQNPALFAQRKIFTLDQIAFAGPIDAAAAKRLMPLKTLTEVEQELTTDGVKYQRRAAALDSLSVPPALLKQITALPPGEVFVVPSGGGVLTANVITGSRIESFGGDQATNYAMNMILQQRVADAAKRDLDAKIETAKKAVKYQEGYAPPPTPAKPGAAAPAATN